MSTGRPQRKISRFDYKIYNVTGLQVPKGTRKITAEMANFIDEELKIVKKLSRFHVEYELSLLYEVDDVEAGIRELKYLVESYEDVHLKLKREIGDEVYEETYTDYDE